MENSLQTAAADINSDAAIMEAMATIYSNWISNEQNKNKAYIIELLNKLQDAICQIETEERRVLIKEQFKIHAETLDSSCRISIYGVFSILNEAIHGEKLKNWAKDFADNFLQKKDKNFFKKKDNYDLKKCFENIMKMVNKQQEENQRRQEVEKQEEKRLAKIQKNKMKRERKKLAKKSAKAGSQEIKEEEKEN